LPRLPQPLRSVSTERWPDIREEIPLRALDRAPGSLSKPSAISRYGRADSRPWPLVESGRRPSLCRFVHQISP
jgi:hypothetical protein